MTAFLTSLGMAGLNNLASAIFSGIMDKGEDKVKEIFKDKLGLDIDFNKEVTEVVLEKLRHNEVLIKLELDNLKERNKHEETLIRQELEYAKLEEVDRESARAANVSYSTSNSWLVVNFLPIFSLLLFTMISWSMYYILDRHIESTTAVAIMEFDKAIAMLVIGFWFGSSISSKRKGEALEKLAGKGYGNQNIKPVDYYKE